MKALTVWQPWASLIIIGAKAYEFRKWDYTTRCPHLVGKRIVIHAGTRMPKIEEVEDILQRIEDKASALDPELAVEPLERMLGRLREIQALGRRPRSFWDRDIYDTEIRRIGPVCTLGAGLGTAILGEPAPAHTLFDAPTNDSYRMDHSMWAWPLTDVKPWDEPIEMRGKQGFWNWRSG